ncbi:apolipo protein O-domain-containing protein [Mycotypha africana]|uniref:apolipo protein O-domain-containing protein n=1 Tax=Mycotypha africana TaxID=64632 RepID=UPI0023009CB1|nr:apolipo protein O-domain-containing protein [Mycotypha africana]KAI8992010.1 apolipo protein O-domain-containing protein [Mycotypha africana]
MFSSALKRSLATAAVGSVLIANAAPVLAEEKRTKLSIYDEPEPKVVIVESPTKLEEQVHYAQKYAHQTLQQGKSHVDTWVNKYKTVENDLKTDIDNIIDKNEEIMPNILYVGVAALAGTVIARRRNIVLRFLTSTTLAIGTSYYLLPKTTCNVGHKLQKLENRYPQLKSIHQQVDHAITDARKQADETVRKLRGTVDENTSFLRKKVEQNVDKVRSQVNQTTQETKEKVDDKFDEVKKNVESMYSTRAKVTT